MEWISHYYAHPPVPMLKSLPPVQFKEVGSLRRLFRLSEVTQVRPKSDKILGKGSNTGNFSVYVYAYRGKAVLGHCEKAAV